MTQDFIEEEMKIMEEMAEEIDEAALSAAIGVNDPISILNLSKLITVPESSSLQEVLELMAERKIGAVVVADSQGDAAGIFTERDVITKVFAKNLDLKSTQVTEAMTHKPETLSEIDPIAFALNKMSDGSFRHIPIRNKSGELKSMLSVKDIVDQISTAYRKHVLNLPPNLKRDNVSEYGG